MKVARRNGERIQRMVDSGRYSSLGSESNATEGT